MLPQIPGSRVAGICLEDVFRVVKNGIKMAGTVVCVTAHEYGTIWTIARYRELGDEYKDAHHWRRSFSQGVRAKVVMLYVTVTVVKKCTLNSKVHHPANKV